MKEANTVSFMEDLPRLCLPLCTSAIRMNGTLVRKQQMFSTRQIHYNTGSFKTIFNDIKSRNTEELWEIDGSKKKMLSFALQELEFYRQVATYRK